MENEGESITPGPIRPKATFAEEFGIAERRPSLASPAVAPTTFCPALRGQMQSPDYLYLEHEALPVDRARSRERYSYAVKESAIAYRNSAIAASNASLGGRTRSCGRVANGSSVMFSMSRNVGLSGLT
jgi:hypothetical protein